MAEAEAEVEVEVEAEPDRISSLPRDVKVAILSFLPIKESVRTSVLAPSWRCLWTFLPGFHMGPTLLRPPSPNNGALLRADSRWFDLLHHLLSSLQPPIVFLSISHGFGRDSSPHLHRILQLAKQKDGLEALAVHDLFGSLSVRLPSFHHLKSLHLHTCNVSLPPGFQGFQNLSTIEFFLVSISNDDLHLLIDSSKQLCRFMCYLDSERNEEHSISIRSPNLTHLDFRIYGGIKSLKIVSAPLLMDVHISGDGRLTHFSAPKTVEMLSGLVTVSRLELTFDVLNTLIPVGVRQALPVTLNKLTCLRLAVLTLVFDEEMYDVFIYLLRSASLLKTLVIQSFDRQPCLTESHAFPLLECMKKQEQPRCLNQSLTRVVIEMNRLDVGTSIGMIKFLLLNANALKTMWIAYNRGCEVEPRMIEELRNAKVTSSEAKLVVWRCEEEVQISVN